MKKKLNLTFSFLLLLSSCNQFTSSIGGLEDNAELDKVTTQDVQTVRDILKKASFITTFSYETTVNVTGSESHFVDYYTPHAWYEDNDDKQSSFGYAETKENSYLFKYYLSDDEEEVYPSIYEYSGINEQEKVQGLYSSLTITHINLLSSYVDDMDCVYAGTNKFIVTDIDVVTIFRFMTTYGSAIADYLVAVYVDIVSLENTIFSVTIDLGDYGNIVSIFTPLETTKIDFVNEKVSNGDLIGVDYYEDVHTLLYEKMTLDNFVLEGIKQDELTFYPYTINCTKNYFYLTFDESYEGYNNFGYVLVPKNQEITYQELQEDGSKQVITQTLDYDACYGISEDENGNIFFDSFLGPVENESIHYQEVDTLPTEGSEDILYITLDDEGNKVVYEWIALYEDKDGNKTYGYNKYSSWYDSVGDFYFNGASATFYLSGTPLTNLGFIFFEKDLINEDSYYSTSSDILSALANGLFGWGFQSTTTWMSYVTKATLKINKDSSDEIISADIGLNVLASTNGGITKEHNIYYTVSDFNQGNVAKIDTFLQNTYGG